MKIDCGFFDKDGNYKEDIQEIEMLSVKELNEIELIKAQNKKLKEQNKDLQRENARLKEETIHQRKLNQELIIKYVQPFAVPTLNTELFDKNYKLSQTLQDIKAIAIHETKELTDSAINGGRYLEILDLITKAEEE